MKRLLLLIALGALAVSTLGPLARGGDCPNQRAVPSPPVFIDYYQGEAKTSCCGECVPCGEGLYVRMRYYFVCESEAENQRCVPNKKRVVKDVISDTTCVGASCVPTGPQQPVSFWPAGSTLATENCD